MTLNGNTSRGCHFLPHTRTCSKTDMTKILVAFDICLGMRLQ